MKRITAIALIMGIFLCGWLFAQSAGGLIDITNQNLNGDELNKLIRRYVSNVSNLIPDSTTMQNLWAVSPDYNRFWGVGANGSFTFLDRTQTTKLLDGPPSFGGSNMDLGSFSEGLPYLPALALDMRGGYRGFDIGLTGMYFTPEMLQMISDSVLGEGSNFTYGMGGIDLRYTYVPIIGRAVLPNFTVQAGYFFTYMDFGFKSGGTEEVEINFRNDTYLVALQISKQLGTYGFALIPFVGGKVLFSKTNSGFSWETNRPVSLKGEIYPDGLGYHSGANEGEHLMYFQVYGGLGIQLLGFVDVTAGVAYNVITEHFGVSASVRARFAGDMNTSDERKNERIAKQAPQRAASKQKEERQRAAEKKEEEKRQRDAENSQREAERQRNAERQREADRQRTLERQEEEKVQRETERQKTVERQEEEELGREAAALRDVERLIEEERQLEAASQAEEASE